MKFPSDRMTPVPPTSDPLREPLKACPFCGEATRLMQLLPTCRPETPYDAADRLYPRIVCEVCYVEVAGRNEDYRGHSAIEAWNRRATPSTPDTQPTDTPQAVSGKAAAWLVRSESSGLVVGCPWKQDEADAFRKQSDCIVTPLFAASPAETDSGAAPLQPGQPGTRYRHIKRGTEYTLRLIGQVQCDEPLKDYARVVVYTDDKADMTWARPPHEFFDGRFERIADAHPAPSAASVRAAALEEAAALCDAQHDIWKADNNHAAFLARRIRCLKPTPPDVQPDAELRRDAERYRHAKANGYFFSTPLDGMFLDKFLDDDIAASKPTDGSAA